MVSQGLRIAQNRDIIIEIKVTVNGEPLEMQPGEKLQFGMKKNKSQTIYDLFGEATTSNVNEGGDGYIISFDFSDTNIDSGYYYYDIAYLTSDGKLLKVTECEECYVSPSIVRGESE